MFHPEEKIMRRIPVFFALLLLILAVGSVSAQNTDMRRTVFPQLAVGGGWSCDFFINNQGFGTITGVKLSIFNEAGAALVVTSNGATQSSFQFNLAPGETKIIKITGGANAAVGYAELIANPWDAPIRATMVIRAATAGGQTSTQLGIPEQYIFGHYSFAAEVNVAGGVDTGFALVNPKLDFSSTLPIDLVVSIVKTDGTVQGIKTVSLDAGEHIAHFLGGASGLFPGLDNFSGTVSVSGPDHFGLVALRLETGTVGTVSVNEGAILAPYFLNQQAVQETEANDSVATAQQLPTLPTIVTGVMSTKDDIDHFKFTGQAGQVVNVLVELPSGSELDSEVYLLDSNSAVIALNDQNGLGGPFSAEILLPEYNGSYMTCILPANGTYYLKLWDYFGEFGGATFTYRMHVSVSTP